MRGALVFVAVFIVFLLATISYTGLPPGGQIYDAFNFPSTNYQVFGSISVRSLASAVFNGVIYGIIVWVIYTLAERTMKAKPQPRQPPRPQTQP